MSEHYLAAVEQLPLHAFTEKAYLDYAVYVILDRALPHIADGLKPVQRRIVYAMSELGLKATAAFKKSARTVGDVLGKYHPHGDTACYEAMVLMAQDFSYRYPLIDGQGNWGSTDDPKSFAAMRYTESRLTLYAQALLSELQQGTTDWKPNFDASLDEPVLLPARLPNVLLNGASGIAVGMATDIPPHNLTEVVEACIYLLDHPEATLPDIFQFIQGPDFPTRAEIITTDADRQELYAKGQGTIRQRAAYKKEKGQIVVTALPYQVSGAKVLEQIAAQMTAKKLPDLVGLRDESDHENQTRLLLLPRSSSVDCDALMSHLFAKTDLERSYRVNFNMIGLNGRPEVKPLLTVLHEWLTFRKKTVRRRLQFRLEQLIKRQSVLEALLIAQLNIDQVIQIIREADEPSTALMTAFQLTVQQAQAILEIKLRQLARLEAIKLRDEQTALGQERLELESILGSSKRLDELIREELRQDQKNLGDERRSPIVQRAASQALKTKEVIVSEAITVILSQQGWVRAAKGHEIDGTTLSYRAGDACLTQTRGSSRQAVIFLDSEGRAYTLPAYSLSSARGFGEPLTARLSPQAGSRFVTALMGDDEDLYLIASTAGYGFVTTVKQMLCRNKRGKALLTLASDASVLDPCRVQDIKTQYVAAVTNAGYLLLFPVSSLPQLSRGRGNKLIHIPKAARAASECCIGAVLLQERSSLVIHSGKRHLQLTPDKLLAFRGERGRRGYRLPRGFRNVDSIVHE